MQHERTRALAMRGRWAEKMRHIDSVEELSLKGSLKLRSDVKGRSKLTERGGIGLVMFHLARLGHEFVVAHDGSASGDIWVQARNAKISMEVKTTLSQDAWHVHRGQVATVDLYCLVKLSEATCYLLSPSVIADLLVDAPDVYPGVACLKQARLPQSGRNAWNLLGGEWVPETRVIMAYPRKSNRKAPRRVKQVMKNGEIKIYEYPPCS